MPNRYWTTATSCVFILLTLIGCTSDRAAEPTDRAVDAKLDAALRQALRADSDTTLQVLIELDAELNEDKRTGLEAAALENLSGSNRIVTATGTPDAIRRAAALPYVRSLSLSQERPPLN